MKTELLSCCDEGVVVFWRHTWRGNKSNKARRYVLL